MDDRISYGVFWATKYQPNRWTMFCSWVDDYDAAMNCVYEAKRNPQCVAVKIVERVETFNSAGEWEVDS